MAEEVRRRSPRAPSMALDEALARAVKAYDKERLHPAPADVIAQHIGYKGANNGSALAALASMRYFGLLERPKDGMLSVSKDVETFQFAPDSRLQHSFLVKFLQSPDLYKVLLEKYPVVLPSNANLRYELINMGFSPHAAETALAAFIRSVEFVGYYSQAKEDPSDKAPSAVEIPDPSTAEVSGAPSQNRATAFVGDPDHNMVDRIPVRLEGGRRAWLTIPSPFYESDKARLKAQIDLILADEK